jgi:transglutaminase-like putative cysteine protease
MPRGRRTAFSTAFALLLGACGRSEDPPAPPDAPPAEASTTAEPAPVGVPPPSAKTSSRRLDAGPAEPTDPRATSRWYEQLQHGQKSGWLHVVWSPSTWEGRTTVHDTTTSLARTARRMDRVVDEFEDRTVSDLERGEDGTYWWSRAVTTEGDRVTTEEVRWTGDGYDQVVSLHGEEQRRRIDTKTPVFVDAESFLGPKILSGAAKPGDRFDLPLANFPAGRVDVQTLEVIGPVEAPGPDGPVPATAVRQRDPRTGHEVLLAIDREGALASLKSLTTEIRRVRSEVARERPAKAASYSITIPSSPPLERMFSADRAKVDVHLRGDADRPLPEFPESPWSRATGVEGSDATGWVIHLSLSAVDSPDAKATIPVADPAFAKDLEPTVLMPCGHPDLVAQAKEVVGTETDARRAVTRISHFVFTTLEKESPDVGQTTALEILEQRKGDCSEHALLFVALCRAAGIPARRCTGYVCVGEMWGAHAWGEVWTGAWIGVDPTTDDVGTAARYVFYGRPEDPESHPGLVTGRTQGRMRIVTTEVEEGDERIDLTDPSKHRVVDAEAGTASHRLAGIELRGFPKDWDVTLRGPGEATVRTGDWTARIRAFADQGTRDLAESFDGATPVTFSGAPAVRIDAGKRRTIVLVSSRRRIVNVDLDHGRHARDPILAELERVLAPTFAMRPGK